MTWSLELSTVATMVGGPKTFWGDQRAGRQKNLKSREDQIQANVWGLNDNIESTVTLGM